MTRSPTRIAPSFVRPAAPRSPTAWLRGLSLLIALGAGLASPGASGADVVTESRSVGAFRTVRLIGSADLLITQSSVPALTVEGSKDAVKDLVAEMRGDELVLSYEPRGRTVWWSSDRKGPRFLLSAKSLERISTAGSGDIRADALTVPGDFEIAIAGSSDVVLKGFAARKLLVRIAGAGEVTLVGGVLEQNVRIAGSGDYHGASLQSATATVSIGGSGDATLWARDNLSVKIAGSGDVKYYGRPALSKSIAGSGSVTGLGDKP